MARAVISQKYLLLTSFSAMILVIQPFGYMQTPVLQQIYANNSPSFVRQEIIDTYGDWFFWKGSSNTSLINTHHGKVIEVNKTNSPSDCKINNEFISPDIQSASYISNGRTLNATVWLTSPFEEPPKDTIDIFREKLEITISKTNLTLSEYIDQNIINVSYLFDPSLEIVENSTIISGKPAYKVVYTDKQNKLKVMQLWTITAGKAYNITYSAIPNEYDDYYSSKIKHMIDTFEIGTFQREKNIEKQPDTNFSTYEDSGIRISYPVDWDKQENTSNELTMIVFSSPFDDKREPSWHEITFTMAIDIDSVHDAGTDYRVIYSKTPNNVSAGNWSRQIQEISAYDKIKVLEEDNNYTAFDDTDGQYIPFSFNLDKINSPHRYKAVFYITDYYVKDHRLCRLIDTTNWVIIPPPEFSISASPNSVVLRPGDEKNIELQIKGNTDLQSEAALTTIKNADSIEQTQIDNKEVSDFFTDTLSIYWLPKEIPNLIVTYLLVAMDDSEQKRSIFSGLKNETKHLADLAINFIPNKTSIPPSGTGTSTLHLKVSENATSKPYTIPISANISFPTAITNRGGETFSNNKSVSILESSNLTLTVLPPYSTGEQLKNFSDAWITPISGIWTFLAGVGAVIAPLVIQIYRKKQKKKEAQ